MARSSLSNYDNSFLKTQNSPMGHGNSKIYQSIQNKLVNPSGSSSRYRMNSTAMVEGFPTLNPQKESSNAASRKNESILASVQNRVSKTRNTHRSLVGQSVNMGRNSIDSSDMQVRGDSRMYRSIDVQEESPKIERKSMYGTISVNEMALAGMKMYKQDGIKGYEIKSEMRFNFPNKIHTVQTGKLNRFLDQL